MESREMDPRTARRFVVGVVLLVSAVLALSVINKSNYSVWHKPGVERQIEAD